jgi:elongation factor G
MGESLCFVDCPGSIEFAFEAEPMLAACDAAVVVAEADEKKIPALQLIMRQLDEIGVPRILFLNKVDKIDRRRARHAEDAAAGQSPPLLLRQIPLRKDGRSSARSIWRWSAPMSGANRPKAKSPRSPTTRRRARSRRVFHARASRRPRRRADGAIAGGQEPPRDEVFDDLAADLRDGSVTPVLIGTAEKGNGVLRLLKAIRHDAPDVGHPRALGSPAARLRSCR